MFEIATTALLTVITILAALIGYMSKSAYENLTRDVHSVAETVGSLKEDMAKVKLTLKLD